MASTILRVAFAFFLLLFYININAQNWEWQNAKPQGNALSGIFFVDHLNAWACGDFGTILHTTDGGESWIEQERVTESRLQDIHFINTDIGFAVTGRGEILGTTNGGAEWEVQYNDEAYYLNAVHTASSETAFAVGGGHNISGTYGSIFFTNDRGETWQPIITEWDKGIMNDITFVDSLQGWACGLDGVIKHTTDGGVTWSDQTLDAEHIIQLLSFTDSEEGWAIGYGAPSSEYNVVLLKTIDGGDHWFMQSSFPYITPKKLSFVDNQRGWMIAEEYPSNEVVLMATTDGGQNWEVQPLMTAGTIQAGFFLGEGMDWLVGDGGLMMFSSDDGMNWSPYSAHATYGYLVDVHFINAEKGWSVGAEIISTENGGETWTQHDLGYTNSWKCVNFLDEQHGWILASQPSPQPFLLFTSNGGLAWDKRDIQLVETAHDAFFVDEMNGWVAGDGSIVHTNDGGISWTEQHASDDIFVYTFVFF